MVIAKTLLMMNALTNAVMKAKISRPVPNAPMNSLTSSALSSATCSPVIDLGARREHLLDRRLHGRHVGALDERDVDRVDLAVGAEPFHRRVEVEGDDRRAAEAVGVAEPDEGGERAGVLAGVGQVRHLVADVEVLHVGGGLVDGELVEPDRRRAVLDRDAGEAVVAHPRHADRGTGGRDGVAVGIDELCVPR